MFCIWTKPALSAICFDVLQIFIHLKQTTDSLWFLANPSHSQSLGLGHPRNYTLFNERTTLHPNQVFFMVRILLSSWLRVEPRICRWPCQNNQATTMFYLNGDYSCLCELSYSIHVRSKTNNPASVYNVRLGILHSSSHLDRGTQGEGRKIISAHSIQM